MHRVSHAQKRYLLNLLHKRPTNGHCKRQSDYGGLACTEHWAYRMGYTTHTKHVKTWMRKVILTPAGKTLAEIHDKK